MIELRELGPDDWPDWRDLRLAALAEAPYAFGSTLADWQGEGDQEDRWRSRLGIAGGRHLIALVDGRTAGMVSGVPGDRHGVVELISMWVAPEARGRGVGEALVEGVVSWGRSVGAVVVRLDVADGNDAARALYEREGFVFTGELGDLMSDGVRRERVMERRLSESRHEDDRARGGGTRA